MQRRAHLHQLVAALVVCASALAACGDDSRAPTATEPDDTAPAPDGTASPTDTTAPPADGFEHPTDADDVVVEITFEGGFVPVDHLFRRLPTLLVAGDGRRYVEGPQIEIYPQPLLPNVQVSVIGEAGIQTVLDLAADRGLLAERYYDSPNNIADAPDTVVTIVANGETYVHRAYALGLAAGDEIGDRAELAAFVEQATALSSGQSEAFEADAYLVRARPVDDLSGFEIEPTVVDWPADAPLRLDAASGCALVPADPLDALFGAASELTFFVDDATTYQLSVKPQLPGDGC